MGDTQKAIRTMRGIQHSMIFAPPLLDQAVATREPKGAVYTKRWVVELILDLAGYTSNKDLAALVAVEPSAGDGAFLVPMIERLVASCGRHGKPIAECHASLVAFELNAASAVRAKAAARAALTDCGMPLSVAQSLSEAWVRQGDYLFESISLEADFVIGNPPYVRLEDIPEETAAQYRCAYTTMTGRADLYVGFFEAALRQLKRGGRCAFICADRWMRNQYGTSLRELITSEFAVDVVVEMHAADAFQHEVDAYPAITVMRRGEQGPVMVANAGPELEALAPVELASILLANFGLRRKALPNGLRAALVHNWFQGGAPWPCQSPEQLALLRRLEDEFPALETSARVGIGVATGNDKVFITRNADAVEPSRLLKLAMAKDIGSGSLQWSGHYLLDPWNGDGLVDLADYPRLRAYYAQHAEALKKRHTAQKNTHAWYKTIDRVTHALTGTPKLYIADIRSSLDPVLDSGRTYPHHNLYYIQSSEWDLEVLGGLLISAIGQFFVASYGVKMRGGYLRFQAQYLRRIRVPPPASLSAEHSTALRQAFRERNRKTATKIALEIYRIDTEELERALAD